MKKIVILIGILLIVAPLGFLAKHLYFHYLYYKGINQNQGIETNLVKIRAQKEKYLKGSILSQRINKGLSTANESRWVTLHFSDVEVPFPYRHPMVSVIPTVNETNSGPKLGVSLVDYKNRVQVQLKMGDIKKVDFSAPRETLFSSLQFREFLRLKSKKDIWVDIHKKDLLLELDDKETFIDKFNYLLGLSTRDLTYNLYILSLRNKLFRDFNHTYGLLEGSDKFIAKEDEGRESGYFNEKIYIFNNNSLIEVFLTTRKNDVLASTLRKKIIHELSPKVSFKGASNFNYQKFLDLSYQDKKTEQGMLYLLSAWSHETDNRNFLKYLIRNLEKGNNNLQYLMPLYDYAYKKFNTNFSSIKSRLKETSEERLKRLIIEEENRKKLEAENAPEVNREISSKKKSQKEILQEVIENKVNTDEDEAVLSDD